MKKEKSKSSAKGVNATEFSLHKGSVPKSSDSRSEFSLEKKSAPMGGNHVNQPKGFES